MRFREVQLIRYGRFEDCILPFEHRGADLHLIIGPNEAGKSTTLAAISDLLFRFEHRTRYDFRFDRQALRVGAIVEDEDGAFEVRRRKGNNQTLVGPDDAPISETRLVAGLAGQTRESYARLFSLDQERLRAGGRAILEAHDEVGQAIFAAGSGLVQINQVCSALEEEAKAIWTNRSGSRAYSKAADDFRSARAALRDSAIKPAEWIKARRILGEAESELQHLKAVRDALVQDAQSVQRKRRVLVSVARRRQFAAELETLGPVLDLSETAIASLELALATGQQAQGEVDRGREKLDRLRDQLVEARPSDVALRSKGEIEALQGLEEVISRQRSERPALQAQLDQAERRLTDSARDLGWRYDGPESLKQALPARADMAEITALIETRGAIDEQVRAAFQGLTDAEAALDRTRRAVDAGPVSADMRPLVALAREIRDDRLVEGAERATHQVQELSDLLQHQLLALRPWTGDLEALQALDLPTHQSVDFGLNAITRARSELDGRRDAHEAAVEQLEQAALQLRQRAATFAAPSAEDLTRSRDARQVVWAPLSSQLQGGPAVASVEIAIADFEAKITASDNLADDRFIAAEHAGGLAELEREIERKALLETQASARVLAAEAALNEALAAFSELVAPCSVKLDPHDFPGWRAGAGSALETGRAIEIAAKDRDAHGVAEGLARASLGAALGLAGELAEQLDLRSLLREADSRIDLAAEASTEAAALKAAANAADTALARARTMVAGAESAEKTWTSAWEAALLRTALPAGVPTGVKVRLDMIEAARKDLDIALDVMSRLKAGEQETAAFDRRVSDAAVLLGQPVGPGALSGLASAVQKATRLEERTRSLEEEIAIVEREVESADARLGAASLELVVLSGASEADDSASDFLNRARIGARLRNELQDADREILTAGEGRDLPTLLMEVEGANPESLESADHDLAERIAEANQAIEAQAEARRAADINFTSFKSGPDAAIAAFELAQARATVAEQAEAYIRKRAELIVLKAAIERYRKDKQAPILTRASALFATLTLNAFTGLVVDLDSEKPALMGVRGDGDTYTPTDGMSEGTTDQLYLALRIAAVEDLIDQGIKLPFLADDLFVNFDDDRAAAGFRVLAELAGKTQVLFFTHHAHLSDVASQALAPHRLSVCGLSRDAN